MRWGININETYPEISDILEISVQAARNLMYRTLIHLRESIGEKSMDSMKKILFILFIGSYSKKIE